MDPRRRRLLVMALLLLAMALVIWGPGDTCSVQGAATAEDTPHAGDEWINSTAYIETDHGTIVVEMADLEAPVTVGNFIELADTMFYDNMRWHRVVDDFVIQTGDPNSRDNNPYNDGTGGSTKTIPLEIHENLTHEDGAIGMARSSEPDSASSQFYICDGAQHGLDGDYAVFGYVIEGIEVVRSIASVEVYGNRRPVLSQHPVDDVWLYSVRIDHGYYNATPHDDGPSEPVAGSGAMDLVRGGVYALVVAVPLVLIPFAFLVLRRERRGLCGRPGKGLLGRLRLSARR
jgi:peptidyl-prolyl cis-trans isomerase B (cyclophilin B)